MASRMKGGRYSKHQRTTGATTTIMGRRFGSSTCHRFLLLRLISLSLPTLTAAFEARMGNGAPPLSLITAFSQSRFVAARPRRSPRSPSRMFTTVLSLSTASSFSSQPAMTQQNITDFSEVWDDSKETTDQITNENDSCEDDAAALACQEQKEEFERWNQAVNLAVRAVEKKEAALQAEWAKAQNVETLVSRAQLLVSNLYLFQPGVKTATVVDWETNGGAEVELTLDTAKYDSAAAEADALFAQARKLKRGSQVIGTLLEETDKAKELLVNAQLDLQSTSQSGSFDEGRFALVKDRLRRTAGATKFQIPAATNSGPGSSSRSSKRSSSSPNNNSNRRERKPEIGTPASNLRKLKSPGGCTVLVGRNRRGNEYLSLTLARGNDIWMHSRGCPGAHVLIMNRRGGPKVTDSCLQFAADLAIFYSDLRNEKKAEVTAAEPKHILKPRGAPLGAVKIREEWKTLVGRPERVPDELKEARDQSGQTDEYHLQDKALHRRRTRQAAEEDRVDRLRQKRGQRREQ